ncbi:MAG: right-handed parallel beta-helix repeat-containing protein, partial [Solirubrobacterales bacterium]
GALDADSGGASLDNVTVSNSFSGEYGGGLYAADVAEIIDSTFEGNDTDCCEGGGAYIGGDVVLIERSTFRNNKAGGGGDYGAGFYADDPDTSGIIRDSLFEGNEARRGGGAYLDVSEGAVFEVSGSTFRTNTASASGGAAYFGGRGIAQVSDSTFEDNSSGDSGGALEMNAGTITGSTFSGNSNSAGNGSAVFMSYGPENVIENSTFTGNSGYNVISTDNSEDPAITLEVNNVTLAGNTLDDLDYPAIDVLDGATANLEVSNSIIAQDDGPGVDAPGCAAEGTISSGGGNVIQDTTTGCDALVGGPPAPTTRVSAAQIGLQALALNAPGTTETMAIGSDSVAARAGVLASCLPTDQRGVSRPADSCSSGAYQAQVGTVGLSVTKSGTGSGTVTSSPEGIDCGETCEADFEDGATVTLTATPAAGSTFTGWSGACSGTGTCEVTMSEERSVDAAFTADSPSPTAPSLKASVGTAKKVRAGKTA